MAMKFLVTFVLLISIGEIYSKSLLEKIRDDSDLSQVSVDNHFLESFKGFKNFHPPNSMFVENEEK